MLDCVFPTCVGVNRRACGARTRPTRIPHVRGGEPSIEFTEIVTVRLTSEMYRLVIELRRLYGSDADVGSEEDVLVVHRMIVAELEAGCKHFTRSAFAIYLIAL